jgi:hypothetical protein
MTSCASSSASRCEAGEIWNDIVEYCIMIDYAQSMNMRLREKKAFATHVAVQRE